MGGGLDPGLGGGARRQKHRQGGEGRGRRKPEGGHALLGDL